MSALAALTLLFADGPATPAVRVDYAQLTIRQRVIVRIPARPMLTRIEWRASKGPRCTPLGMIGAVAFSARDSVDLILRTGERLRAEFRASCPALDFYSGVYMLPTDDRRLCADRDSIHARSGGECEIRRFRRLKAVPAPPPPAPPAMTNVRVPR